MMGIKPRFQKSLPKLVIMEIFDFTINKENGIHARPAGKLVNEASKFQSNITVTVGTKSACAKGLFALMGLGIKNGDKVTIECEGPDESEAANALREFFQNNFSGNNIL